MQKKAQTAPNLKITTATVFKSLRLWAREALGLPLDKIVRAYQNNQPAPFPYPFAYFSVISVERKSTNHSGFSINPLTGKGEGTQEALMSLTVQLDIYGPEALDLAQRAMLHFRSPLAVDFFKPYGIAPVNITSPFMLSASRDERGNWGERSTQRLNFSFTNAIYYPEDYFTDPDLQVINSEISKEGD